MSTSYDPPQEESKTAAQVKKPAFDDATTQKLISRMEREMTRGREGGVPSESLDLMMHEISKMSTDIVIERKKLL